MLEHRQARIGILPEPKEVLILCPCLRDVPGSGIGAGKTKTGQGADGAVADKPAMPQDLLRRADLFYIAPDGTLMAVAVNPEASEFENPQKLFATGLHLHSYSIWMNQYGVAKDGQRFLLNSPAERSPVPIMAVIAR